MTEHLLEIKIVQAGRVTGQYHAVDIDTLRLEKIVYPGENLPFDVGILPTALTPFDEPFAVLVVGSISHPIRTEIESQLIGALQRDGGIPILLAVPQADEGAPHCLDQLRAEQRAQIETILSRTYPGKWHWLTVNDVEPELRTATLRFHQKQDRSNRQGLDPAWKPLHVGRPSASFAEAERYTAAEYTFYELPYRFQHYLAEHLAPDERVLYAARRPAMISESRRSWLRREHLQEGVLILTDQRLVQLAELVPPDSSNVRYGFRASIGVLERLEKVSLTTLGNHLLLRTEWQAAGGNASIQWESAGHTRMSLEEIVGLLNRFRAGAYECSLRRAMLPAPPEKLPLLTDSGSSNPDELALINEQFSAALIASLSAGEKAYAWAFLPKWLQTQKVPQALVVTDRHMFLLPDRSFDVALAQVATLEFTSSILESSLAINYIEHGVQQRKVISFHYPAQDSFRTCFETARRCMAVLPLIHGTASPV